MSTRRRRRRSPRAPRGTAAGAEGWAVRRRRPRQRDVARRGWGARGPGGVSAKLRRICRSLCYGLHTSNVNSRHSPAADYETASVIRYLQPRAPQIHPDSASAPGWLVGSGPRRVEASESAATAQLAARGAANERAVAQVLWPPLACRIRTPTAVSGRRHRSPPPKQPPRTRGRRS
eukprot:scaffold18245_cov72-Phaeocystis_antarctica.AAC.4